MRINRRTLKRLIREELEAQGQDLDSWWGSLDPTAKQEIADGHKKKLIKMLAMETVARMAEKGVSSAVEVEGDIEQAAREIAAGPEYSILDDRDVYEAVNQAQISSDRYIQ
tara:strand:+ start:3344 stop:3676 length:333 start_codon:yes stop_codon:yes gene_type:complete